MKRTVAIGIAIVLAGCGATSHATPTPQPPASIPPETSDQAHRAVDRFVELMADPDVTYRASGVLRAGALDDENRPDVLVNTRYDVKGADFGGGLDIHLRDPTVGGWFNLAVVDEEARLHSSNLMRTVSFDAPASLVRPGAIQGLTADDLSLLRLTGEGLFEFRVDSWLGGDPLGQWVDLGAVPEGSLPRTEVRSHDSRLLLDGDGVPVRFSRSWSFSTTGSDELVSGSLVEEIEGLGMYVTLDGPVDILMTTSHDTPDGPWRQITVPEGPTGTLEVRFVAPAQPMILGIEGAIFFVRSHDLEGEMIRDEILGFEGGQIEIGAGQQTVVAYYRTCNAHCSNLEAARDFCAVDAMIEAEVTYELTVAILSAEQANCTLEATS